MLVQHNRIGFRRAVSSRELKLCPVAAPGRSGISMTATVQKFDRSSNRTSKRQQSLDSQLPYLNTPLELHAYATALDSLGSVSIADMDGRIIYVNEEFLRITKYGRDQLIGQTHRILNSGHHSSEFHANIYDTIQAGRVWRAPICNRAQDGSTYWMDKLIVPLRDKMAVTVGYLSFGIDITQAVNTHVELRTQTQFMRAILDQFPGGIAVYDQKLKMVLCNEKQKEMLEYPPEMFEQGFPSFEQICRLNAQRGEYGEGDVEEIIASKLELARRNEAHIFERKRPNGLQVEVRGTPMEGGGFVSTYLDITQRKKDQETIARLARHDVLTGLANRVLLQERMELGLARVGRGDTLALLCLDLDRFKPVNDLLGHPVGDMLLKAVARRLENCVRAVDTVARLGGDEFAIILQGVQTADEVALVAQRVLDEVSKPYQILDHTISVGTSIGISAAPGDATDTAQLMTNADLALYRSKAAGRGQYTFFQKSMQERVQSRHLIQNGLREALASNGFKLHYQPIVRLADREIVSCEALIRWSHPERGLVSAAEFIPIAEECGLIGKIGEWVLNTACREAQQWPRDVSVAVNISAAQLRGEDLEKTVTNALNGLDPSRLVLEITESLLMQNNQATSGTLDRLRKIGVRFALDDFGTGYSSLSYLQSFPFDKIKIDRSFISAEQNKNRAATLRRAIIQLGLNLGMTTVAEGIETEEQYSQLRSEECVLAQGYLFSKAIPNDELIKSWFRARSVRACGEVANI
jgi:diguanylate cyclase (GGDEF)-like protein/PAS domain S-box-containing protein